MLQLVGPARVVEEVLRRRGAVEVARLADRLAVVEALEHGELTGPLGEAAGDAEQVAAADGGAVCVVTWVGLLPAQSSATVSGSA